MFSYFLFFFPTKKEKEDLFFDSILWVFSK